MKYIKLYENNWSEEETFLYHMRHDDIQRMIQQLDKININSFFDADYTLLITACLECRYTGIKFLLTNGADPYLINKYGHDAYYYADKKGKKLFTKLFPDFHEKRELHKIANKYNI
jgi:ankyrin repeat protein